MAHELPRLRPRRREAEPIDDVVEPPLQQLSRFSPVIPLSMRRLEVATELLLQHAVDAPDLLLLAKLQAVARELRLPRLAVLSGRKLRFSMAHFSV